MMLREQLKRAMNILGDLDLMNTKKGRMNQIKLHKAYDILDDIDAQLEREEIKRNLKEDTNE